MKSWRTTGGYQIFKVLNRRSNSYLINFSDKNILVDTGKESSLLCLQKNINSLNISSHKIDLLILTHAHYDHCQNVNALRENHNCKVYLSTPEDEYARLGFTPIPDGTIPITRLFVGMGRLVRRTGLQFNPFIPDVVVDGALDLTTIGLNISFLPTPGHSAGSMSVIIENEVAVVGDAMFGIFRKSVFPPFADNRSTMIKSWGRILKTGCHTFLPGHGKEISRELLQREFDHYSLIST